MMKDIKTTAPKVGKKSKSKVYYSVFHRAVVFWIRNDTIFFALSKPRMWLRDNVSFACLRCPSAIGLLRNTSWPWKNDRGFWCYGKSQIFTSRAYSLVELHISLMFLWVSTGPAALEGCGSENLFDFQLSCS